MTPMRLPVDPAKQYAEEEVQHARRSKNRIAQQVRLLEARNPAAEALAKREAMPVGTRSAN